MSRTSRAAALLAAALVAGASALAPACSRRPAPAVAKAAPKYRCAMHPEVVSDKPGTCPICRMELVAVEGTATPTEGSPGRKVLYWYDPMAPGSRFDKPGKSPFMDMPLVPMYEDQAAGGGASAAAVTLEAQAIRAAGIGTQPAVREALVGEIRAVGSIEVDETRQTRVAARIAGRIEKLFADFTGQLVRAGEPLYSLYSPELVATQREYLLALENREKLAAGTPDARRSADALVAATRDRLRLWGVAPDRIAALERDRRPDLAVTFSAPITGTVLQKLAVEGQYVAEGAELYQLADLSRVWLMVRVYEYELGRLRVGQEAEAEVSALPGRSFRGRIAFIEPVLERETRSAGVRIELANPRGELKPGMFAQTRLEVPASAALTVPRGAVIDTGTRRVVYVETAPNVFTPRQVRTGEASADRVAILEGLREGEKVVAAASFFVDSQAQLSGGAGAQYSGALEVKATPRREDP
ncbi:MAG TPA: efflux RND transporter periplasmic adaptor subunit [Thermoanaerobaculia bacterium]